jgi:hypothetical protein
VSDSTDRIKSIFIPPHLHSRIKTYADENLMSVSEATVFLMDTYASGERRGPAPKKKRVTIWVPHDRTEQLLMFSRRAKDENITQAAALEMALEMESDS